MSEMLPLGQGSPLISRLRNRTKESRNRQSKKSQSQNYSRDTSQDMEDDSLSVNLKGNESYHHEHEQEASSEDSEEGSPLPPFNANGSGKPNFSTPKNMNNSDISRGSTSSRRNQQIEIPPGWISS